MTSFIKCWLRGYTVFWFLWITGTLLKHTVSASIFLDGSTITRKTKQYHSSCTKLCMRKTVLLVLQETGLMTSLGTCLSQVGRDLEILLYECIEMDEASDLPAVCRAHIFMIYIFIYFRCCSIYLSLCVETIREYDVGILEASGMREVNPMSQIRTILDASMILDGPLQCKMLPHFQEMARFNRLLSQMTMTLKQLQKADVVKGWKTATNSWLQLHDTCILAIRSGKKVYTFHNNA